MVIAFGRGLEQRINGLDVEPSVREDIVARKRQFVQLEIPTELNDQTRSDVQRSVKESFIDGFRVVTLISAALGILSAFFAWLLISGNKKRP